MDAKLEHILQQVKLLCEQNPEFKSEMEKLFSKGAPSSPYIIDTKIDSDITTIREALELRANPSILYDFIDDKVLKGQLLIDNLRMENAALNLSLDDDERFFTFCVNAFYQVENIINYYFYTNYPDIEDVLLEIESQLKDTNYPFDRSKRNYKNISDIDMNQKLNAMGHLFGWDSSRIAFFASLRKVRNEGAHRCTVEFRDNKLDMVNFRKYNSYDAIRSSLQLLVDGVRAHI